MRMLSHKLSQAEREKFWNALAAGFEPVTNAYSTKVYQEGEWRLFKKYFSEWTGKKLLKLDLWNEVHNTGILLRAARQGFNVHGLDISQEIVKTAQANFKKQGLPATLVTADMRAMPFQDNAFDYLYTMGTIEHVPNPEAAIREMYRVLKPGGVAVIGVPYRYDPFGRAAFVWMGNKLGLLPYGDEKCFSWREFRGLLERGGTWDYGERSGAYFMPWPFRFLDMFFTQKFPYAAPLLKPFLWIFHQLGRVNFLTAHNSLISWTVKKPIMASHSS